MTTDKDLMRTVYGQDIDVSPTVRTYHEPIRVDTTFLRWFLDSTVPNYKRRHVLVQPATTVTFHNLNWSGGTRTEYRIVRFTDCATVNMVNQMSTPPPWNNSWEGLTVPLIPDYIVIEGGLWCGKPATLTLHVHPNDLYPFIPED